MMTIQHTDKNGHTISIMLNNPADGKERAKVMTAILTVRKVKDRKELKTPIRHIFG